jgi:hypothetical protein
MTEGDIGNSGAYDDVERRRAEEVVLCLAQYSIYVSAAWLAQYGGINGIAK